jgi:dihydroorotate dehydrogenase
LKFYASILKPLLFCLDAERAHHLAMLSLRLGLYPRRFKSPDPVLKSSLWGLEFPTPIGMAAGFDKNAEVFDALLNLGFGFVETGSVTPLAQPGNVKPRLFRLLEDQGVINRLGFNNLGLDAYTRNIKKWMDQNRDGIVGANIGKNKNTEDSISDFVSGVLALANYASYLVINVSSPNTPGLRDLQARSNLKALLVAVMQARAQSSRQPPLLVKMAPDLTDEDKSDIAEVVAETKIDGIIVTNTTIERPDFLKNENKFETGGLSGEPLFEMSTQVLHDMYRLTDGKIPLIGVGGVSNGEQAYKKIKAGASLVQLYSAMIYRGPGIAVDIAEELVELIRQDGFSNISEAIGADHR